MSHFSYSCKMRCPLNLVLEIGNISGSTELFYRPQAKFAKVMFLQVSVCPQGGHAWLLWGACVVALWGGVWLLLGGMRGCSWGACLVASGGMYGCSQGVCMVALGGMCGCSWGSCMVALGRGVHGCSWGNMCGCFRGVCMGYDEIRRYDQCVGSMHPTGMHSCGLLI